MTKIVENHYIGIDVSKYFLDVCFLPLKDYFRVENNQKGFKELIKKLQNLSNPLVVMEASGGYEKFVSQALVLAHFNVSVVNPRQIRDFAKATGTLAKTDRIDAYIIALFAQKMEVNVTVACNENQQDLNDLQVRRKQLIDMIGMEKNRLDKARPTIKKSLQKVIKSLEKELNEIDELLEENIMQDEELTEKTELLQTIKGVGKVVASSVLAFLPEIGKLEAKQISALAGLAPYNNDSGNLRGKRMIWGGRANLRSALYMGALVAIRYNLQIKSFYQRLCSNGKPKKVALVACMHKLLIIMNAMIKNKQPWQFNCI